MMRIGLLAGTLALLLGIFVAEGVGDRIRPDDGGFGPPHIGNCSGGNGCGMTLVIDNTVTWEAVP